MAQEEKGQCREGGAHIPKGPKSACGNNSACIDYYSLFKGVFKPSVGVNSGLDAHWPLKGIHWFHLCFLHQVSASASTLALKIKWILGRSKSINVRVNVILRCEGCVTKTRDCPLTLFTCTTFRSVYCTWYCFALHLGAVLSEVITKHICYCLFLFT